MPSSLNLNVFALAEVSRVVTRSETAAVYDLDLVGGCAWPDETAGPSSGPDCVAVLAKARCFNNLALILRGAELCAVRDLEPVSQINDKVLDQGR